MRFATILFTLNVLICSTVAEESQSLSAINNLMNDIQDNEKNFKKVRNSEHPIQCSQYHVYKDNDTLEDISNRYRTGRNLYILNPEYDLTVVEVGTPICVVGKLTKTALQDKNMTKKMRKKLKGTIGKRPRDVMKFKTTVGVESCVSILKNSFPPVSKMQFLELNPNVSCKKMLKKSTVIFLPKGTTFTDGANTIRYDQGDQDCLASQWSEWSMCENGEKQRTRNIFQEARGDGKACPDSFEKIMCNREDTPSSNDTSSSILEISKTVSHGQCLKADGCSNPVFTYNLFAPACNFHDICWACRDQWTFANEHWCNGVWNWLQHNTCHSYWRNWFDTAWCTFKAQLQYETVELLASPTHSYKGTCPSLGTVLNKKLSGRYIGHVVPNNCACEKNSCLYRGEPFPCWGRGTICGAGTTCNNCCNGYSWWWSKFFTACN